MSEEMKSCPKCASPYGYLSMGEIWACPECGHEWNPNEIEEVTPEDDGVFRVFDANGVELKDGDSVIVMKNLPVKGAPRPIRSGTKVNNIRLKDADHNIDCKIDGFGSMALKSEFVRKA